MPLNTAHLKTVAARLNWNEWIVLFGLGSWAAWKAMSNNNYSLGLFAVLMLTAGCVQLAAHRWAWRVGLASWTGVFLFCAIVVAHRPSTWRMICLLGILWGLWNHYTERPRIDALSAPSAEPDDSDFADAPDSGPANSLVLWLREPRFLDEAILSRVATEAFDLPFNNAENAESFIVGKENIYMLRIQGELYHLHQWHRSYFDDPVAAADSIRELRRADAVRRHQAWIAIDHMPLGAATAPADVLSRIGRLAAALSADGDDVIAVYHPSSGRIAPWDASLREKLVSAEPLSAFNESAQVPVIQVEPDSPALVAAVAEARRRWPEFVAAFRAAADPDRFSVKAPVTEGERTEFIWINVKAIADGRIHGFLANEPVALGDLKLGAFVSVAEAELNDWVFPDPADATRPLGLFTVKAVTDAACG